MKMDRMTWSIFVGALIVRAAFVFQWLQLPHAALPYLDAKTYNDWAIKILNGELLRQTAFYQSPLYPYLMAAVYAITGPNPVVIAFLQVLLGAITCALLANWAAKVFDVRVGWATGILSGLYAPLIFYSAPVMKETLGLFLLTVFLVASLSSSAVVAGASLGLAALTRTNLLLLAPLAAFGIWRQERVKGILLFGLSTALMILPATFHNWKQSGDPILVNYAGGFNFYIGHWIGAAGANAYPPNVSTEPEQEEADTIRIATQKLGRALKPSEVSNYWFNEAVQTAKENPVRELQLSIQKLMYLFNDYEVPDNYDLNFIRSNFPTILSLPLPGFALILVLATIGIGAGFKNRNTKWLVIFAITYVASVLPFYVTDRYRLPLVIFLLPLAGLGAVFLIDRLRNFRAASIRSLAVPILSGVLALILAHFPIDRNEKTLTAYGWGFLAGQYSDLHDDEKAIEAFQKALNADSKSVSARALIKVSTSYERLKRDAESQKALEWAVEWYPEDGLTYTNLGRFHLERGRAEEAERLFKKAIEVSSWIYQPYIGLGVLALQSNQPELARKFAEYGLTLNPDSPELKAILKRAGGE